MTLEKAISCIIEREGVSIISNMQFSVFLDNMVAFDTPAIKRIVETMISSGYFKELQDYLLTEDFYSQINDVHKRLVQNEGFQSDLVKYVLDCLLVGLHKKDIVPVYPQYEKQQETTTTAKKSRNHKKNELSVIHEKGICLVNFEGQKYELDETQYRAILRKKDMPANRLKIWLTSYSEENK